MTKKKEAPIALISVSTLMFVALALAWTTRPARLFAIIP
jgi:hypothetical protein